MAEFKLSQKFRDEISELKNAGDTMNSSAAEISSEGVDTLKTSMKYIEQHEEIIELMNLFRSLVIKDAGDLETMMAAVEDADTASAQEYT